MPSLDQASLNERREVGLPQEMYTADSWTNPKNQQAFIGTQGVPGAPLHALRHEYTHLLQPNVTTQDRDSLPHDLQKDEFVPSIVAPIKRLYSKHTGVLVDDPNKAVDAYKWLHQQTPETIKSWDPEDQTAAKDLHWRIRRHAKRPDWETWRTRIFQTMPGTVHNTPSQPLPSRAPSYVAGAPGNSGELA